jgi:hypothetical protein
MPAYWFMHNMYALARNANKYIDRDKRLSKTQYIEYDFLAPDTVNELFTALNLLRKLVAIAHNAEGNPHDEVALINSGELLLSENKEKIKDIEVNECFFENTRRPTRIIKVWDAYRIYKQLVVFYGVEQLLNHITTNDITSFENLLASMPFQPNRSGWKNIGGQLIPEEEVQNLLTGIKEGRISDWYGIHQFYKKNSSMYEVQKLHHAYASLMEILQITPSELSGEIFKNLLQEAKQTKAWMNDGIYASRAKDYQNEFKKMVYDNEAEMEEVVGKLDDNSFIRQQEIELQAFRSSVESVITKFGL